jgi:quercetin 2,3-dioxygenase
MTPSQERGAFMLKHLSETRGLANHGWLISRHTFSFANYYNPERMGFGALRVINDDSVAAGMGFGTHPHRDMEIISIPIEGSLQHKDSEGNSTIIKKGEVQIMSAGTGISHSEFNASQIDEVKFLQIWVLPKKLGIKPRYDQKFFSHQSRDNKFALVVSPDGREQSVEINQDAFFSLAELKAQQEVSYQKYLSSNGIYVFILSGDLEINGERLSRRDGIGITDVNTLKFKSLSDSEVLVMEVPE